jgi:hypothetical protein
MTIALLAVIGALALSTVTFSAGGPFGEECRKRLRPVTIVPKKRAMTTILRWVARSALQIEWFIEASEPVRRGNYEAGAGGLLLRVVS